MPRQRLMVEIERVDPCVDLAQRDTRPMKSSSDHVQVQIGERTIRFLSPNSFISRPNSANMCVFGRILNKCIRRR